MLGQRFLIKVKIRFIFLFSPGRIMGQLGGGGVGFASVYDLLAAMRTGHIASKKREIVMFDTKTQHVKVHLATELTDISASITKRCCR